MKTHQKATTQKSFLLIEKEDLIDTINLAGPLDTDESTLLTKY